MTIPDRPGVRRDSLSLRRLGPGGVALAAALIYVVTIGGGSADLHPLVRLLNAVLGGALIIVYVLWARMRADSLDRLVLSAVVLFSFAGVLSRFPRQSFDAVLAALAYAAAFFVARELLFGTTARRVFVQVFVTLSTLFTIAAALLWFPQVAEWMSLMGWRLFPPLDMQLIAWPWGYRYDLALLIALLYPAWFLGRPSFPRRMGALLIGVLALAVVVITGSRTVWLAVALATAVLGIPALLDLWKRHPRVRMPAAIGLAIAGLAALVMSLVTPVAERLLNFASLDWRLAMWGPLTELWLAHPLAGIGPGAFPWALQLTSYFDTRSHAPRHPDNALFQVLPEAGLLGLLALAVVTVSVLLAVVRSRSTAARWAAVVFVVASVGGNPTDFAFLVIVGIAWAAYAAPRAPVLARQAAARSPRMRIASLMAIGIIFVAHAATLSGAFAYEAARSAVARGALGDAERALDLARSLDPGMALYHRQRGALAFVEGDIRRAVIDLETAVTLNPADDLGWRTLALARDASGNAEAARAAVDRAVAVQRSDSANLLLAIRAAHEEGRSDEALSLLAEVVHAWPAIVAAPGWHDLLPVSVTTEDVVHAALERWLAGRPVPELTFDQGVWLAVLSDRPAVLPEAIERSAMEHESAQVLASLIACEAEVGQLLDDPTPSQQRDSNYWLLRLRASVLKGETDVRALKALRLMTGGLYGPPAPGQMLNLLNEIGSDGDRWGYRRYPISWPMPDSALPSIHVGRARWIFDPWGAAEASGLDAGLDECRSQPVR